MTLILAITPILVILVLMVGLRWGAARAGAVGYVTAFMIAILFFGAGTELLAYSHAKAFFLSVDVLFIIWAAFLLYRVADEAGAIKTIGQALPHLTPIKGLQALLIGWIFASFLQGVGGFGVPVAVIAPILIGLGFSPLSAVVIPSIGHGWAVTFGSLGSSFLALMASTGLSADQLAAPSALFLGIACIATGPMVAHAAGGWQTVRQIFIPTIIVGTVMAFIQYIVVTNGFWYIGSFIAGIIGLAVGIPLALNSKKKNNKTDGQLNVRALIIALSGYILLIVITLIIQLVPGIKSLLSVVSIQLEFPEIVTKLDYITPAGTGREIILFRHTGMILIYASIMAYLIYRKAGLYSQGSIKSILNGTVRRVMSSSVSIASMVTMAVIMQQSGMTDTIARGLADGFGSFYPIVAPWIGALGAFMTGSNTNSNVVFGALQQRTAELLGYSIAVILAAQTSGAALGSVMAPTKVVVGASTAGLGNREGDIMRKLVVYASILIILMSIFTVIVVILAK